MTSRVEHHYAVGASEAADIQRSLEAILADPATQAEAADLGLSDDLAALEVRAEQEGAGFDPVLLAIVITIAGNLGSSALEALWVKVLYPRLRGELGLDVLGERKAEDDTDGDD